MFWKEKNVKEKTQKCIQEDTGVNSKIMTRIAHWQLQLDEIEKEKAAGNLTKTEFNKKIMDFVLCSGEEMEATKEKLDEDQHPIEFFLISYLHKRAAKIAGKNDETVIGSFFEYMKLKKLFKIEED